ncbi:MAG: HTTM domain-containing protein [Myxococcales bacterium]|nr:HTTM domain-containing protein [Myxococcales bacterium]
MRPKIEALRTWLSEARPSEGLAFWRVAFGLLLSGNVVRYALEGWIDELFVAPRVMFPHWGFSWLPRPDAFGVAVLFGAVFVGGLAIAWGRHLRVAAAFTFVPFTWLELLDRSTYLNHYYLVSLVLAFLAILPTARGGFVPRVTLVALRAQVGLVYFFAGVAKLRGDWLFEAEPLTTWLARHTDTPLIGSLLDERWVAFVASWAGMLFDLVVVFFLLARRTRPFAFAVVVFFHLATAALFPLGLFPWLMIANATLFFAPTWPRRVLARGSRRGESPVSASPDRVLPVGEARPVGLALVAFLALHFVVQVVMPFRQHLYAGEPLWHEQGFRFAWCVMLVEKTATLDLRVVDAQGRETIVHPREELTPLQQRMVPTQPDLVLAYAHHVRDRFRADGHGDVKVFADGFASLHGRPRQRLVDPNVDLAQVEDGLAAKPWIVPLASGETFGAR